jgi:hypothetical protein
MAFALDVRRDMLSKAAMSRSGSALPKLLQEKL